MQKKAAHFVLLLGVWPAFALTVASGCGERPAVSQTGPAHRSEFVVSARESDQTDESAAHFLAEIEAAGLTVNRVFSRRVGGGFSVSATAQEMAGLQARLPELVVVQAVVRQPLDVQCGDSLCAPEEAASAVRESVCSLDCGALPPKPIRDERINSWQVQAVGADKVWSSSQGEGIRVCVLDSGYDNGAESQHPDRPARISGKNPLTGDGNFADVVSHGTHVTGILAAAANGLGAVGISPKADVRVYPVFRLLNGKPIATDADVIAALDAALGDGCHIVNLSLGGASGSDAEHLALRKTYEAGVLVVAASGNGENASRGVVGTAQGTFPGAYPESLTVGAVNRRDELARFSGTGPSVGLSAPGVGLYSSVPRGHGERQVRAAFEQANRAFSLTVTIAAGSAGTDLAKTPIVDCGWGSPLEIAACQPLGQVALIQRGPGGPGETAIAFYDKIRAARAGSASAVLLYNHRYGPSDEAGAPLEGIDLGGGQPIPVFTVAAGDGEWLARQVAQASVTVSAQMAPSDYAVLDGTSMAAPVVSGVAALIWSKNGALSNVALRQLLSETAVDLGGPGRDDFFGSGRIDAARALAQLVPRAVCGDGTRQRDSEICDGTSGELSTCDALGFDGVLGGSPTCNATCTGVTAGSCQCVPGRTPFAVGLAVEERATQGGVLGVRFRYHIELLGRPVPNARIGTSLAQNGRPVLSYRTEQTDAHGDVADFVSVFSTGLPAGEYQVTPLVEKGGGRCRDAQPTQPAQITIRLGS